MAEVPLYDQFSANYDRFVNWQNRLAFEWPFLNGWLERVCAHRLLDVACGTGQHAIAFAQAGYEVVGADLSEAMIAIARENTRIANVDLPFIVAGFGDLAGHFEKPFDATFCLGNSLPHVLTAESLRSTLRDFRAVLRQDGVLIVQNLNFDKVWTNRERFMPAETYHEGDEEWIFFRFYDFHEETITFNINTLHHAGAHWESSVKNTELRPIFRDELADALSAADFTDIEFYGNLAGEPFDPARSGNLVSVARAE